MLERCKKAPTPLQASKSVFSVMFTVDFLSVKKRKYNYLDILYLTFQVTPCPDKDQIKAGSKVDTDLTKWRLNKVNYMFTAKKHLLPNALSLVNHNRTAFIKK